MYAMCLFRVRMVLLDFRDHLVHKEELDLVEMLDLKESVV